MVHRRVSKYEDAVFAIIELDKSLNKNDKNEEI